MDIPYEKQFHFRDGESVATVEQLKEKIERVSYQEFYHHVNAQKNDFAAWIRHVHKDERLADDLQKVTSIVETVEIINDHLHPRPITAARSDMQSRIEQDLYASPLGAEAGEGLAVEEVPSIEPAQGVRTAETADFTIIEENASEPKIEGKVREELFGTQTSAAQPALEDHDASRMIVRDFMYGLVFGLIVGLILGRILSF
jgi:hypothetical protein